ncbi:MAG: glutamine--fructose-6-phosphate transaminase (isomerizing) [Alphaproteobacteria bacterium]
MCGIIGITGQRQVAQLLIDGLKRLEYRGYDSAGIATLESGDVLRRRAKGKLFNLQNLVNKSPISGTTGIGHTRWATHGVPDTKNAHPHSDGNVSVVHNGIIENHQELKQELSEADHTFETDTDTEVIVHLISAELSKGATPPDAASNVLKRLKGAFALAIIFKNHDNLMIGARQGSPLAVGYGDGEMYLGSDAMALAHLTKRIAYLEEGDWCIITPDMAEIYDSENRLANRQVTLSELDTSVIGKGNYRHYMLKEIFEQPSVIGETLLDNLASNKNQVDFEELNIAFENYSALHIVACGTAFYAASTAKYWFEELARIPVNVDIASEFRYRNPPLSETECAIFISQSGETIDTLEALRHAKRAGLKIISIVNSPESTIARESDIVLKTLAGPEIGVASTKAFTTQLTLLACLAISAATARGKLGKEQAAKTVSELRHLPALAVEILEKKQGLADLARPLSDARDVLYLGRNSMCPLAYEGALKLKEISYIHAEGYAAGELKHGPIALIDDQVPVVVCAPTSDALMFEKTASNIEEVVARGGKVILISDKAGIKHLDGKYSGAFEMPNMSLFVAPILYSLPIQLLAYYTAVEKGTDVDQPRNLAKSVTVE